MSFEQDEDLGRLSRAGRKVLDSVELGHGYSFVRLRYWRLAGAGENITGWACGACAARVRLPRMVTERHLRPA